ncbi:MAG: hypothetical protein U5J83_10290, partial [Bryobacterales bacterium]|nr:hypothetical protein [Bryobacterales bacterium]
DRRDLLVTTAIRSLVLWFEGDFDRTFLLAHNPLRDDPMIVALFRAITRFGMSAICLLLLASVIASYRFPALRPTRPVLPLSYSLLSPPPP